MKFCFEGGDTLDIIRQIEAYKPWNEQVKLDKVELLKHIQAKKDIFTRENKTAHMTASAWVVNGSRDKALMVYHNIYDSWSWMGGHADGDENLHAVASREVMEESGLSKVRPIIRDIFSLEILTVDGHEKNGVYIPSHLHLNVTYLFEGDEGEEITVKPDENSGVAWYSLDEAVSASSEPWFRERIYSKLNEKLGKLSN
jgi:ADP-ribose pyrophosphatase YjhB (NUDIX family)